jgi:type II secretory pathway pseudopilin PulG
MYKKFTSHSDKLLGVHARQSGLTILEMTVVILVLLTLAGISFYAMTGYREWQRGSEGSRVLRMVYNAQRTYLAEHPIESPSALTAEKIIPYLSNGSSALPTAQALDDSVLTVNISVSPPVLIDSEGNDYDPSGDTDDGLWDVGS